MNMGEGKGVDVCLEREPRSVYDVRRRGAAWYRRYEALRLRHGPGALVVGGERRGAATAPPPPGPGHRRGIPVGLANLAVPAN